MAASTDSVDILHVDDEPSFADMAATFLERKEERIEVQTATGPDEALQKLTEHNFDGIISDYDMPGRNGVEFLEAVRERYPDLPFILYTGKGSEEVASEAISAGVTDYLQKGSGSDQYTLLANRVKNAVERTKADHRAEEAQARYQTLIDDVLETSEIGTFILDANFEIVWINSAVEEYFGLTRDDVIEADKRQLIESEIADKIEDSERFKDRVTATYDDNTYVEEFSCHVLPGEDRRERWLKHWSQPIESGLFEGGRIEHYTDITERKEREQELRRTERRFEAMFQDPNILVGLIDTDGTVLDINKTAMQYIDEELADIIDQPFWETSWFSGDSEIQTEVKDWIDRAANGEYVEFEADLSEAVGEPLIINGVFRPVKNDEGEVVSLLISDRDITERKEREEELQRKERRYRAIFQDPHLLVGLLDVDGAVREANETALNIIDANLESVKGVPFWETPWWDHSEELQADLQQWIEAAASGEYVTFEATHLTPDDERVVVDGRLRPVRDDSETVVSIIATGIDITEQKQREEELRLKDRAMDAAPVGILLTDSRQDDNPIIYANQRFQELTGYDEEEILGRNCRFLQGEDTESEPVAEMRRAIENKVPITVELRNYRKDGSEFWNRVSIAPVRDDDDGVTHFVGFQQDITEWK